MIQNFPRLVRLERYEISAAKKSEMTPRGYNEQIIALINQETHLLPLLKKLIDKIEELINNREPGSTISGVIRRAIKVTNELIRINVTEIRELEGQR